MGLKFIQRILVGFFVLNVLAVFLFTYYLASTIKEADLASTEASLHANENWIPLCEAEKDFVQNEQHNCSLLDKLSFEDYIASGWTKTVHRSRIGHIPVAIKSINIKGKDINDCVGTKPMLLCYNEAVNKFGREIDLLQKLNHTSIIKLLYYCYKTVGAAGCMKHAMVATELADPLSNIKLLQMSWRQRKLVIQGLASLIHYAETSPLGSLGIADLRRPQFVLIKGQLKLADLDDILVGEPTCFSDEDCSSKYLQQLQLDD